MIGDFVTWLLAVDPISQFVLILSTFAWVVGIVSLTATARDFVRWRTMGSPHRSVGPMNRRVGSGSGPASVAE